MQCCKDSENSLLVSCPDPLAGSGVLSNISFHVGGGADLGFEITNQITKDLIIIA